MGMKWSGEIERRFHATLPADVADWFNQQIWKEICAAEFYEPVHPDKLLDVDSGAVWGGQMLPDTLPVLGNGMGDALCLRFTPEGTLREVIRWNHEGGSWCPYGRNLAEAVITDAMISVRKQPQVEKVDRTLWRFVDWAAQWSQLGPESAEVRSILPEESQLQEGMLTYPVSEVAIRRELCHDSLASELLRYCLVRGGEDLAAKINVEWPEFQCWLFDTGGVPLEYQNRLTMALGTPFDLLARQDWEAAAVHANRVLALRPDIAWPYAILGWAAERKQNIDEAIHYYFSGRKAAGSSQDFIEHELWRPGESSKFAIRRLQKLTDHLPLDVLQDEYLQYASILEVRKYWLLEGQNAEKQDRPVEAYLAYYNAGWDDFFTNEMCSILESLTRTAKKASFGCLARIAEFHLTNTKALGS